MVLCPALTSHSELTAEAVDTLVEEVTVDIYRKHLQSQTRMSKLLNK